MTLTEFLLARIAEDEAAARAGISGQADPENGWGYGGFGSPKALTPHVGVIHERVQAEHIIRWHPVRVLAECEAKRAIVNHLVEMESGGDPHDYYHGSRDSTYSALRALAAVYADHPEYREEWAGVHKVPLTPAARERRRQHLDDLRNPSAEDRP